MNFERGDAPAPDRPEPRNPFGDPGLPTKGGVAYLWCEACHGTPDIHLPDHTTPGGYRGRDRNQHPSADPFAVGAGSVSGLRRAARMAGTGCAARESRVTASASRSLCKIRGRAPPVIGPT